MSASELERRVGEHARWWHSIDLGNGVLTPGHKTASVMKEELDALALPDLRGKTVLDIGAWGGYFSFAAERLGASRVLALDCYMLAADPTVPLGQAWDPVDLPVNAGVDLAREALGSDCPLIPSDALACDRAGREGATSPRSRRVQRRGKRRIRWGARGPTSV